MKIELRILMEADGKSVLRTTGEFTDDQLSGVVMTLDADNERLPVLLEATKDTSGSWFNPVLKFTKKELESSALFQLEYRKALAESQSDIEWNERHIESLPLTRTAAGMEIGLPDAIALSKVSALKPNMVAGVGQVLQEHIVHTNVAAGFADEGLSGFSLLPVFNSKTETAHDDVKQLYCTEIMPPAVLDRMTPPSDGGGVRLLGCLLYEDLDPAALSDFNRTAEDWGGRGMPYWVVSSRVRDCFLRNKFKGWSFRPVLVRGSDMHRQYERMWRKLFDMVAVNPRNFF